MELVNIYYNLVKGITLCFTIFSKKRKLNSTSNKRVIKNLLCEVRPEIFAEIKQELNPGIDLKTITRGSRKLIVWTCCEHKTCEEHVWKSTVENRCRTHCPFCQTILRKPTPKRYCKCSRPSFLNEDGMQKGTIEFKKCVYQNCLKELPITEFNKKATSFDGYQTYCKACTRKSVHFQDSVRSATMRLFFHEKECGDCSENDTTLLECDHIHDDKSKMKNGKKIGNLIGNSRKNLAMELNKCEIVCAFCHRLRTQSRKTFRIENASPGYLDKRSKMHKAKFEIGKCTLCPRLVNETNISAFDFDHINPNTKISEVTTMLRTSPWSEILVEIAKCQLLCVNCHRKKTASEQKFRKLEDFTEDVIFAAKQDLALVTNKKRKYDQAQ